jgi:hypothetical protein
LKDVNRYGDQITQTQESLSTIPEQTLSLTVARRFDDLNKKKSGSFFHNNLTCFTRMLIQHLEVWSSDLLQSHLLTPFLGLRFLCQKGRGMAGWNYIPIYEECEEDTVEPGSGHCDIAVGAFSFSGFI